MAGQSDQLRRSKKGVRVHKRPRVTRESGEREICADGREKIVGGRLLIMEIVSRGPRYWV